MVDWSRFVTQLRNEFPQKVTPVEEKQLQTILGNPHILECNRPSYGDQFLTLSFFLSIYTLIYRSWRYWIYLPVQIQRVLERIWTFRIMCGEYEEDPQRKVIIVDYILPHLSLCLSVYWSISCISPPYIIYNFHAIAGSMVGYHLANQSYYYGLDLNQMEPLWSVLARVNPAVLLWLL